MLSAVLARVCLFGSIAHLFRRRRAGVIAFVTTVVVCSCLSTSAAEAGTLTVTWDANTEPDVVGYQVSIGTTVNQFTQTVDVGNQTWFQYVEPDPGQSYYFAVRAYNSVGLTGPYSAVAVSSPMSILPLPLVTTGSASSIGVSGASLNGSVNPNGSSTDVYFVYGPTVNYGGGTPSANLGSGTQFVQVPSAALTGLACGTVYHYRLTARNFAGTVAGADATFSTAACSGPIVTTGNAISISTTSATLTGAVDTRGTAAQVSFQYGPTAQYGSTTTPAMSVASGVSSVAIPVSGMSCGTSYHFRAVAVSSYGTGAGADATFATAQCPAADPVITPVAPVIALQPKDETPTNRMATLSVQAIGTSLRYQWYVGTTGVTTLPIAGATGATYLTPKLTANMSFWVRVANSAGTADSRTATVSIKYRGQWQ